MRAAVLLAILAACSSSAREARPPTSGSPPPDAGAVAVIEPPLDAAPDCLDEVGCVLVAEADAPACCAKYRGRSWNEGGPDPIPELPDTLDGSQIMSGVSNVKSKILACGDQFPNARGLVKLKVTIAPEGGVANVDIKETPDPALGACAAQMMKQARFGEAKLETKFTYPLRF